MAADTRLVVEVEGIDPVDGSAYSILGGRRLRIDYAIPGERVEVRVPQSSRVPGAEVTAVVRASPHRVEPGCPYFGPCGGCTWQHIAWKEQLRLKEGILQALLDQSLGKAAPRVHRTLAGQDTPWAFRNKVHFVFAPASAASGVVMGHYRRRSQSVVPVDVCPVHDDEGNRVAFAVRDALAKARIDGASGDGRGVARHIVVRATVDPRETLATLVVTRNDKRLRPAVRSIVETAEPDGLHLNVNDRPGPYLFGVGTRQLHGRERARETIAGVSFLISPTAFFQTNVRAAAAMVETVLRHAGSANTALDLYAGAGLFALPLASRGVRVTAVEENGEAVVDGEASRGFSRIPERACRFVRARVEDLAQGRGRRVFSGVRDLVVLDPPRAGCPAAVLHWICASVQPARIAYISCNPAALAADLRPLLSSGYRAELIQPVDMFPHTQHIETIAMLSRDR